MRLLLVYFLLYFPLLSARLGCDMMEERITGASTRLDIKEASSLEERRRMGQNGWNQ